MIVRLIHNAQDQEFVLKRLPAVVGRGLDATVTLEDRWASRHHCEIGHSPSGLVVRDLNSTHGTFVNGQLVETAPLHQGDQLSVGLATLRVEIDSDAAVNDSAELEGSSAA